MVRSTVRRIGSVTAAAALVLGLLVWPGPLGTWQRFAVAAANFSCGSLYSLQGTSTTASRTIWSINPANGAGTAFALFSGVVGTINALGIAPGGSAAYGVAANGTARTIYRYDTASGTTTAVAAVPDTPVTHGAVNPRNGFYYYGGSSGTR
ncbi:hypothetical protein A6A25_23485 [Saccharothrix sp. CB00851]|nr:hypothetical protein A6A25_23485 [Saccharothrix sp. CB00851]